MSTLVLGIGNLLLGDEGVGVHAARALMGMVMPGSTTVLDVGTAILDALSPLESAERLIIIDAMQADGSAGSVYRATLDDLEGRSAIASLHGFDLTRALALCGRTSPPPTIIIGVEPHRIDWSLELSTPVAASLPVVVKEVLALCAAGQKEILGNPTA